MSHVFIRQKKNYNYIADCTNLLRVFCCVFEFALVFFVFFAFAFSCECLFAQLAQYWGTYIYPIGTYACFYVGGCVYWGFRACLGFFFDFINFYRSSTYYHLLSFWQVSFGRGNYPGRGIYPHPILQWECRYVGGCL